MKTSRPTWRRVAVIPFALVTGALAAMPTWEYGPALVDSVWMAEYQGNY